MTQISANNTGPLTDKVLEYERTMKQLVPTVRAASDWDQLAALVAVDTFERIGTFLETQDWDQYAQMLTGWAAAIDTFETSVRRITEVPPLVFYEIEERHHRGDIVNVVNSLTVFEFDDDDKIRHLTVYLQQPAAPA
jgi:hypothetical protein